MSYMSAESPNGVVEFPITEAMQALGIVDLGISDPGGFFAARFSDIETVDSNKC